MTDFASRLTDAEWQTRHPKDGRKIGVIVHHVASIYPLEIELAQKLAAGGAITGLGWMMCTRSTLRTPATTTRSRRRKRWRCCARTPRLQRPRSAP